MSMSVQNQNSVLLALQTLKSSQGQETQTGPLGRAADRPPTLSTASSSAIAVSGLAAVQYGLDRASSIADAGAASADQIGQLLSDLRDLAAKGAAAQPPQDVGDEGRALIASIDKFAQAGGFDGVNLLNGSLSAPVQFPAAGDGDGTIALRPYGMTSAGLGLAGLDFADPAAALETIDAAIQAAGGAADALTAQAKQVELHGAILGRLSETLQAGEETGLSAEGARLQALQVRQILQSSGQSIANQTPSAILALFRA